MGDLDVDQCIQRRVAMEDGRRGSGSRRGNIYVEKSGMRMD
jgi:hypothetical protein